MADETQAQFPTPDPALRRLDRYVGTWRMEGHLVGSDEITIRGETTFRWLPGNFFLEQRFSLDFMGTQIESLELIGYDPETDTFPSTVYSNISPAPLPYRWQVEGDTVEDLGDLRADGLDIHGNLERGRGELRRWLASEPGGR